jgi:hypothetical protein
MSCSDKYTPIHYMISNKNLSCKKVALHLSNVGIAGTVSKQRTIICDKSQCSIEKGCLLIMYNTCLNDFLQKIVRPLHRQYPLNCGYVSIAGVYTGCVNNLFRPSNCSDDIVKISA